MQTYKGYMLKSDKYSPSLIRVSTEGIGGKIPNSLDGLFTSTGVAKQQIDAYLDSKPKKEPKNGETSTEG